MKTLNYHIKLIEALGKGVKTGAFASNLMAPSVSILILYNFIPHSYLFSWYFLNIVLYFLRLQNSKLLLKYVQTSNIPLISQKLKMTFFLIALSSFFYSLIIWLSVIYNVEVTSLLLIVIIMIALTAGSISTIGSIFLAFILYISFAIIPLIGAMLYHGGEIFNLLSVVLLVFFIVHSLSAYRHYINLRDATSLRDSFKTIFNQTSDGIVLVHNNRFKDCNDAIIHMFGFASKEEFLSSKLESFSPDRQPDGHKSIKKMLEVLKKAWEDGNCGYQWLHTKKNGKTFWTDINLTRINMNGEDLIYGVWRDISDRKEAEEKLEKLNNTLERRVSEQIIEVTKKTALFETMFNTAKDGIAILDLDSNFLLANNAYANMTGYTKEELYEMSCIKLTIKSMIESASYVLDTVKEEGHFEDFEKSYLLKNEKIIDLRMNLVLMPDKQSILIIAKDITQEKLYIKERQKQEEKLLQHSKLAQMGEMISMIAHQWRQPLGAISSTAVNLKLKLELETFDLSTPKGVEEATVYFEEKLGDIEIFVANLTATIDDFRNFYKPNKIASVMSIHTPIRKTLKIIENSLVTDNIKITKEYNATKEMKLFDNEVIQVLLNIFKNAQDNFRTKECKNKMIFIKTSDTQEGISLEILDNGGGIDQEIFKKIFDPYFSTKLEKNGTGLGLYMSKMIIQEHHHGTLSAKNIDDGICFKIELPLKII